MKSILVSINYKYVWEKDSNKCASIEFRLNKEGKYKLYECKYIGVALRYTEDDWEFLGDLSKEIKLLIDEVNK